jgi:pimeloyl-ACP methyl ester carboxylesterase
MVPNISEPSVDKKSMSGSGKAKRGRMPNHHNVRLAPSTSLFHRRAVDQAALLYGHLVGACGTGPQHATHLGRIADMTQTRQRGSLVLVHGAWHGPWCWEHLLPVLDARRWSTSTIDLPSAGGDPNIGMYDDAKVVREHLHTIDGPVTVLAHSYGGIPVTEVADTVPNVSQLVYLASMMLQAGEAVITLRERPFPPDAKLLPPLEPAREIFYHDVPAELAEAAIARLRPQSARSFTDKQTRASWRTITSTMIVCDEDKALSRAFAERGKSVAATVRHLPGSHSPFLSRPAELADVLDEVTQTGHSPRR